MTRMHRTTTDERLYACAQEAFAAEAAPAAPEVADDLERHRKALLVSVDGVQCVYQGFRNDQLADAVACATQSHAATRRPDPA